MRSIGLGVVAWFLGAGALFAPALAAEPGAAPNFAPTDRTGWLAQDDEFIQPPSGPGPVKSDPARPYISFYKNPRNPHPAFRIADLSNPILLPWTREAVKRANDKATSGQVSSIPKERCWPVGVPASCSIRRRRCSSSRVRKRWR